MFSESEFCLSGQLETDAPALLKDLQRAYDARAVCYLRSCYSEAAKWGGLREAPVVREEGVSYNPRPARILQILMKETRKVTVFSASIALFSTVPAQFIERIADPFSKQKEALKNLEVLETCDEMLQNVVLARALDNARHLHMTSFDRIERLEIYQDISRRLEYWDATFRSECNEQLFLALGHWLENSRHLFVSESTEA